MLVTSGALIFKWPHIRGNFEHSDPDGAHTKFSMISIFYGSLDTCVCMSRVLTISSIVCPVIVIKNP
jgi:hypothetical protein